MATIPFIQARFFSAEQTSDLLEKRFIKHLRLIRCGLVAKSRAGNELPQEDVDTLREVDVPRRADGLW